ncbi:MAG: hypothetical protein FD183_1760 [Chitinophagaceae bacterium]|nr:MAG: hypothetical protein FD183_1760 [Chitinophagaceae bacterium]
MLYARHKSIPMDLARHQTQQALKVLMMIIIIEMPVVQVHNIN